MSSIPGRDLYPYLVGDTRPTDVEKRKLLQFKDLLEKMLTLDPERRISPSEALKHPFIVDKFE